ncbi:hypothetical protein KSP40_PGU001881 [Platanthera guangdongensis]|uniref:Uncharacterized protein n=1 Tax=Platanthera guangdongensis TaxID=2320717 RepID=A0ABR2MTU3_9ASPA
MEDWMSPPLLLKQARAMVGGLKRSSPGVMRSKSTFGWAETESSTLGRIGGRSPTTSRRTGGACRPCWANRKGRSSLLGGLEWSSPPRRTKKKETDHRKGSIKRRNCTVMQKTDEELEFNYDLVFCPCDLRVKIITGLRQAWGDFRTMSRCRVQDSYTTFIGYIYIYSASTASTSATTVQRHFKSPANTSSSKHAAGLLR